METANDQKLDGQRLINIDIIKFASIIIMLICHLVFIKKLSDNNLFGFWIYSYGAITQAGFLFSSGYLLGHYFNPDKLKKYLFRIAYFIAIYIIVNLITGEKFVSSNLILLNFAFSTTISLIFLYSKKIKPLIIFSIILFGLTWIMQLSNLLGINFFDKFLADYSYPVNSFSIYFFLGIITNYYQDALKEIFTKTAAKYLSIFLLLSYVVIFIFGIKINIYSHYLHLPLLIIVNFIILLWAFYYFTEIKLSKIFKNIIFYISDAILYIYVLHYLLFFGVFANTDLGWWQLIFWLISVILLSIEIKFLINKLLHKKTQLT